MAGSRTLKLKILGDVDGLNKSFKQADNSVTTFGDRLKSFGKMAAGAFAAAATAAAAYAIKLGVDMVKAAIADQQAQQKLATTLKNVTGATSAQIAAVEKYIDTTARATGVADDQLRPAFDRLVRSTQDTAEAQNLLKIALDVSAGTGKSLDQVVQALGRAYDGSLTSLSRLGVGIDAASLKSMTFDEVTKALSATFAGQAQASAETYAGKLARMQVSLGELQEGFGTILLTKLQPLVDWMLGEGLAGLEAFGRGFAGEGEQSLTAQNRKFNEAMGFTKDEVLPPFAQAMYDLGDAIKDLGDTFAKALDKMESDGDSSITKLVKLFEKLLRIIEKLTDAATVVQDVLANIPGYQPGEIPGFGGGKAAGGRVNAGTTYLVGEKGPELFNPGMSGTITPNNKLVGFNAAGGGGNVVINVSGALDPEAVARQIKQIMQTSAARTGNYTNFGIAPLAVG